MSTFDSYANSLRDTFRLFKAFKGKLQDSCNKQLIFYYLVIYNVIKKTPQKFVATVSYKSF